MQRFPRLRAPTKEKSHADFTTEGAGRGGGYSPRQYQRRSLAKAVQATKNVNQPELTAVLNAADYARASQVDPALTAAFYNDLLMPLQQGTKKPADACKAAAAAINAILQGKAATPGVA